MKFSKIIYLFFKVFTFSKELLLENIFFYISQNITIKKIILQENRTKNSIRFKNNLTYLSIYLDKLIFLGFIKKYLLFILTQLKKKINQYKKYFKKYYNYMFCNYSICLSHLYIRSPSCFLYLINISTTKININ